MVSFGSTVLGGSAGRSSVNYFQHPTNGELNLEEKTFPVEGAVGAEQRRRGWYARQKVQDLLVLCGPKSAVEMAGTQGLDMGKCKGLPA